MVSAPSLAARVRKLQLFCEVVLPNPLRYIDSCGALVSARGRGQGSDADLAGGRVRALDGVVRKHRVDRHLIPPARRA